MQYRMNTEIILANLFGLKEGQKEYSILDLEEYIKLLADCFPVYISTDFSEQELLDCANKYPNYYLIKMIDDKMIVTSGKEKPNRKDFNAIYPKVVANYIEFLTEKFIKGKRLKVQNKEDLDMNNYPVKYAVFELKEPMEKKEDITLAFVVSKCFVMESNESSYKVIFPFKNLRELIDYIQMPDKDNFHLEAHSFEIVSTIYDSYEMACHEKEEKNQELLNNGGFFKEIMEKTSNSEKLKMMQSLCKIFEDSILRYTDDLLARKDEMKLEKRKA